MHDSDQVTAKLALRAVQDCVEEHWLSDWQPIAPDNDDGIDGIILFRRRRKKGKTKTGKDRRGFTGSLSGAVAFVQVKGGRGYRSPDVGSRPDQIRINLGHGYIDSHRPRWARLPGPAILVWVDTESSGKEAWWTDLNDQSSYSAENKQIVLLQKKQRFGEHSKGEITRLWGTLIQDAEYPRISLGRSDVNNVSLNETLKRGARRYYKSWAQAPASERTHPTLGEVMVSRVGWRHITRHGRRRERVTQSFQLLTAARLMVSRVIRVGNLGAASEKPGPAGTRVIRDYVGLRAFVEFPHRHESLVQVVLLRVRILGADTVLKERVWFFSVYELRRGIHAHPLKGR